MSRRNDADAFWARVDRSADCWEWQGYRQHWGHGRLRWQGRGKALAHRIAYELTVGPIPEGLVVRHKCDNPPCVNPDHLELGTIADNNRDKMERGRCRHLRGEDSPMAKLTWEIVTLMRDEYATGAVSMTELGERFGVNKVTARRAIRGLTWK